MLASSDQIAHFGTLMGIGSTWKLIIRSAVLTLLIMLYMIYCSFYFQADVFLFIDRTTYHDIFSNVIALESESFGTMIIILFVLWIYLAASSRIEIVGSISLAGILAFSYLLNSSILLNILAVISLPTILSITLLKGMMMRGKSTKIGNRLPVNYLVIIGTGLAVTSICTSLLKGASSNFTSDKDLFLIFHLILAYFSPIIMFLCFFSVFMNLVIQPVIRNSGLIKFLQLESLPRFHTFRYLIVFLIIFMVVSVVIVGIPHFNPARQNHPNVSVDVVYYERWISQLQDSSDLSEFLNGLSLEISGGDRPLSLLLMLPISYLYLQDISSSLELVMPLVLAPSLVLVMFLLTRELTRNDSIALVCSFLSAISFHVLVGTYSGYYSNWIGLIVMYLSFVFLIRYLRNSNNHLALFLFTALTTSLLFIHSYTWSIAVIFTFIFVLISYFFRLVKSRRIVVIVSLVLLSLIVFDLAKSSLGLGPSAIGRNLFTIERTGTGVDQVGDRWSNLVRTVQVYVGGIYGNPFFLSIAFLGCILLFYNSTRKFTSYFVLIFFSIGILPLFFGDREILARIMYDIPFQIPAAVAIFWLQKRGVVGMALTVAILLSLLAGSIRIATNI
jgi:hypothetical protein